MFFITKYLFVVINYFNSFVVIGTLVYSNSLFFSCIIWYFYM